MVHLDDLIGGGAVVLLLETISAYEAAAVAGDAGAVKLGERCRAHGDDTKLYCVVEFAIFHRRSRISLACRAYSDTEALRLRVLGGTSSTPLAVKWTNVEGKQMHDANLQRSSI